ncbi:Fic family protein [Candidatus Woesearchaeota archaeon]|nr:Fic family protein [Candidatus Woesearchaeota archaeon]
MYLERKSISGNIYNYLKVSVRCRDKVRTKTIAYLGRGKLTGSQLQGAMEKYRSKAEEVKKETLEELRIEDEKTSDMFLSPEQKNKIEEIKKDFGDKLKMLDEKTRQDMFNDFLILYVYNTNAIEGNTLTLRDTDLLLNKGIAPSGKSLREINDQLNAKEAFQFILDKNPKINHENIIRIHSILMKNIDARAGDYRRHDVRVFGAVFETSPAKYVKTDMNILLKWYNRSKSRLHPLILAAAFHHKFEQIHPFYDGNGRTGRVLLNLILLHNKIPVLVVPDARRKAYYRSLASADKAGLGKLQPQHRDIVQFFYFSLMKTYNTVFGRWGSNP